MYDNVYRYVWTDKIRTSPLLVHTLKTHHISPPSPVVKGEIFILVYVNGIRQLWALSFSHKGSAVMNNEGTAPLDP
jgi:hypothetical protein